jgi:hypothetical protein
VLGIAGNTNVVPLQPKPGWARRKQAPAQAGVACCEGRNTRSEPNRSSPDMAMADQDAITIPLALPRDEAAALAQFVKRVDYDTCAQFSSRFDHYSGRAEGDVIWSARHMLRRRSTSALYAGHSGGAC